NKVLPNTFEVVEKYHELLGFLHKILITIPNRYKPESNNKTLKDYNDSLSDILTSNLLN
ncbi:MAG: hypothetical protein ACI9Q9_001377, partial [Flavobacterium sp.]